MLTHTRITVTTEALQTILNAIPTPMFLKDRRHRLVLVNDALCKLRGASRDELITQPDLRLLPEQRDVFWRVDDEVFATGQPNENEEVLTDGDGALRVVVTRKRLVTLPTDEGEESFIIATISDVTRFREAEAKARYLAQHDALTGLANRFQLNERLIAALTASIRNGGEGALLLLDLDGFKLVNDVHGHLVGDQLLKIIACRLSGLVRGGDVVARCGGDEFCIIQAPIWQSSDAIHLAERIVATISEPVVIDAVQVTVSASVGVAVFPEDGSDPETLLHRADVALYAVKRSTRRGCARYGVDAPPLPGCPTWDIERELRTALAEDRLAVAFQPRVATEDGSLLGFEALARWKHPTRGIIPPDVFIPVAEQAGLVGELGSTILHKACAIATGWPWAVQVSVNVSPAQLERGDLLTVVQSALTTSGLPAERLELEVTESALVSGSARTMALFAELRALGVSLALDDFGTGWSSLAILRQFRFDRIKIDRSFITNLETDARSVAIVRAVLNLAQMLGVPVTAEGIEAQAQIQALRHMGCAELQGFYLGRPRFEASLPDRSGWAASISAGAGRYTLSKPGT